MKWKTVAWIGAGTACAMWLGRAASSGRGAPLANDGTAEASGEGRDGAPRASCELAPNGTLCNHPVSGICVSNRCVGVRCGDGMVYGDEECDDGNLEDGDGCSAACHWELLPNCSNGVVDPSEECDDGNIDDTDECTAECHPPVSDQAQARASSSGGGCGGGFLGVTSASDDDDSLNVGGGGRTRAGAAANGVNAGTQTLTHNGPKSAASSGSRSGSTSSGGAGSASGASSSSSSDRPTTLTDAGQPQSCRACRDQHCRNYQGTDLVAGCLERLDATYGAPMGDGNFIRDCMAVVNCAHASGCANDHVMYASPCYCGAQSTEGCMENGPTPGAPCVSEWQVASRSSANQVILEHMTDMSHPAGWGYYLLRCEFEFCRESCMSND